MATAWPGQAMTTGRREGEDPLGQLEAGPHHLHRPVPALAQHGEIEPGGEPAEKTPSRPVSAAVEILRQRLAPAHFNRAVVLADVYGPEAAVEAGFLDRVVDPADLHAAARDAASRLAQLDLAAHAASKLRARETALRALRRALDADSADFRRRALASAPP
jgi:hypothetical protein